MWKGVEANNRHPHLKKKYFCPIEAKKAPGEVAARASALDMKALGCFARLVYFALQLFDIFQPIVLQFYLDLTSTSTSS